MKKTKGKGVLLHQGKEMDPDAPAMVKRRKVAEMYAAGESDAAIHRATGVALTTITAWKRGDETFLRMVEETLGDTARIAVGQFGKLMPEAFDVVRDFLRSEDPKERQWAAEMILYRSGAMRAAAVRSSLDGDSNRPSTGLTVNLNMDPGRAQADGPRTIDAQVVRDQADE